MNNNIGKVLIANRGEIALRIQRAAKKLGISHVQICSEVDRSARFSREAEKLVVIGPAAAKDSYLNIPKIVSVAKEEGCDAVHPGYGFLSENAEFARAVLEAGLVFIGPTPESIEILGSKTKARTRVSEFGVPCTPGLMSELPDAELIQEAERVGFPVIIKAVAGGGGRGMRIARSTADLAEMLPRARAEGKRNFANDAVYIEKYIERPRHVEVQVFGDSCGQVIHLGTRDCSTQRRHQKLVEEAPAPKLSPVLREKIHEAAVKAAKSVGYQNAGTVEFLVKGEEFYFLEMNTRIQVEHPVTEMVTGIDLVELQFKVARGEPLPITQDQVKFRGHAIEFRIYAEDPEAEFRPATGRLERVRFPDYEWLREDGAVEDGDEVSVHYDAMISKLIVFGQNRADAVKKSEKALREVEIIGIPTTLDFHRWLLRLSPFRESPIDIAYLGDKFSSKDIAALRASDRREADHKEPVAGIEHVEIYRYFSAAHSLAYIIEIVHESGGTFLGVPMLNDKRALPSACVRSNGRNALLEALKKNLETIPAEAMFG